MKHAATEDPEVTVVVRTRNRRVWLGECVDSVLLQTGVAWELLLVDDLSSDGTREWLVDIDDPRIRCFLLATHRERSKAANHVLGEIRGDYVMFLDDDDLLHPDALRILAEAMRTHPLAVAAVGARRTWFTAENYRRRDAHPRTTRARNIFHELLFGWSAVSGQNLYRTSVVRQVGGYSEALTLCEDRDLWLRVAAHGKVVLCPQTVVTYRVHPDQWRPQNIRQIRERVARKAVRALPAGERRDGLRLRRCTLLIDKAEDEFVSGKLSKGVFFALQAVAVSPRLFASPLIGEWTLRRLAGRVARRFLNRRSAAVRR